MFKHFKKVGEIYKAEIIKDIPLNEEVSIYHHGKWHDLCKGPHLPSTGKIGKENIKSYVNKSVTAFIFKNNRYSVRFWKDILI